MQTNHIAFGIAHQRDVAAHQLANLFIHLAMDSASIRNTASRLADAAALRDGTMVWSICIVIYGLLDIQLKRVLF